VPAPRPARRVGAIEVRTDPAVDVLVDGELRGRSTGAPVVIADVPPGERLVTLRLGGREHTVRAPVRERETAAVAYRFPQPAPAPAATPSAERLSEEVGRRSREAIDRLGRTVDRAQREAVQSLRGVLDRASSELEEATGERPAGRSGGTAPRSEGR